jgi:periplasmic protein TonB
MTGRARKTDPRSPVQLGPSNLPYLLLAVVAAFGIWTFQQYRIQDSDPAPRHEPAADDRHEPQVGGVAGKMTSLFSSDDYPAEALDRGEQGTVNVRVDVNSAGRVDACMVVRSSGRPTLDHATCRIIADRARFQPARDADGTAIKASVTQTIVWRIAE